MRAEVLASLRAAVPPDGEIVLESTANGMGGCFYREWQRADETGYVRHFFPWWMDAGYRIEGRAAEELMERELSAEERRLMESFGLDRGQIAFRRQMRNNFGERAAEEFAEDPATCFLASGSAVFDTAKIEARMHELEAPLEERENGRILVWLPPARGRKYILGVDAAGGGSGGDYACVEVIDRASGLQCAELYGHYTPEELAAQAARLGREYNDGADGGGAEQSWPRGAGDAGTGGAIRAAVPQQPVCGLGDDDADASDDAGAVWGDSGGESGAVPEPEAAGGVPDVCAARGRTHCGVGGPHDDAIMAMAMALAVRDAGYQAPRPHRGGATR